MVSVDERRGWIVTFAGLGVNLILGVLYAWGVISAALIDNLGWTATMTQIPYMLACVVFALSMVPGGRLQDRIGPRSVIMASAILAGVGFTLSGLITTVPGLTVSFGLIVGLAMGMGYAAPTPAAVKWFSPAKRGLISGIVVSGFGLAPVYIAPLTTNLIARVGIQNTFFLMAAGFFAIIMTLAQVIKNPPDGYIPPEKDRAPIPSQRLGPALDLDWFEVLRTRQFYMLWTMFSLGTFAGLLLIGQLSKIGLEQAGITSGYILIAVYAIFNATGRLACGVISDRIGRMKTLMLMYAMQVAIYAVFVRLVTPTALMFGVGVVGFTFGGMLTLFPATCADYFGLKNFGVNYGMLITAWGAGGLLGPLLGGLVRDLTGTYAFSYTISSMVSVVGIILALRTRPPAETEGIAEAPAGAGAVE